jgi:hypothetical protein
LAGIGIQTRLTNQSHLNTYINTAPNLICCQRWQIELQGQS